MRVLGIDPGIALTGWAIVDKKNEPCLVKYGCIKTSKKDPQEKRLLLLYKELDGLIKKYSPDAVCIEKLFFNTNAKTALIVGEARGVVRVCCALNGLMEAEFTPLQIKMCIAGWGRADKKQVQQMIKTTLGLKEIPKPDDAADAVAAALTYCYHNQNLEK